MELTIDWRILVAYISGFLAVVASLAAFLGNAEKIKNWWIGHNERKHKRFANIQAPYCQSICPAPAQLIKVNEILSKVQTQIEQNTEITLTMFSDRLQQRADFYITQGWMPITDKSELVKSFLVYHKAGGNGMTMYKVGIAINLPTEPGGTPGSEDLAEIIRHNERSL